MYKRQELWQHAGAAGTVAAVHVAAKDSVAAGTLLIELTIAPTTEPTSSAPTGEKAEP